jgi:hypothetical protein
MDFRSLVLFSTQLVDQLGSEKGTGKEGPCVCGKAFLESAARTRAQHPLNLLPRCVFGGAAAGHGGGTDQMCAAQTEYCSVPHDVKKRGGAVQWSVL